MSDSAFTQVGPPPAAPSLDLQRRRCTFTLTNVEYCDYARGLKWSRSNVNIFLSFYFFFFLSMKAALLCRRSLPPNSQSAAPAVQTHSRCGFSWFGWWICCHSCLTPDLNSCRVFAFTDTHTQARAHARVHMRALTSRPRCLDHPQQLSASGLTEQT